MFKEPPAVLVQLQYLVPVLALTQVLGASLHQLSCPSTHLLVQAIKRVLGRLQTLQRVGLHWQQTEDGYQQQAKELRVQVEVLQQQFQALSALVNRLQRVIKLHHKAFRQ